MEVFAVLLGLLIIIVYFGWPVILFIIVWCIIDSISREKKESLAREKEVLAIHSIMLQFNRLDRKCNDVLKRLGKHNKLEAVKEYTNRLALSAQEVDTKLESMILSSAQKIVEDYDAGVAKVFITLLDEEVAQEEFLLYTKILKEIDKQLLDDKNKQLVKLKNEVSALIDLNGKVFELIRIRKTTNIYERIIQYSSLAENIKSNITKLYQI